MRIRSIMPGLANRKSPVEVDTYAPLIAEARAKHDWELVRQLEGERHEYAMLDREEQLHEVTQRLHSEARELGLLLPSNYGPNGEDLGLYERGSRLGYWNSLGVEKLKALIREEQRWKQSRRDRRLLWIGALTGLIGAAAALAAILKS